VENSTHGKEHRRRLQASMSGRVRKGGFVVFQVFIHHSLLISRSSWRAPPPEPRK